MNLNSKVDTHSSMNTSTKQTNKQKQSHIKKYLCIIWSPKLLATYVLFSFQTYLIINNIVFWILPIAFKVYKDFLCLKVFLYPFPSPFLVYFYIIGYNFVMHARIFMFNFDSFLPRKEFRHLACQNILWIIQNI